MEPITWPEFGRHPPVRPRRPGRRATASSSPSSSAGCCEITGYDAVSLQPNAGSQGELAGLLAIRAYHRSRGDDRRDVCLIPSSAHGTNAASAVDGRACGSWWWPATTHGNVDLDDLRAKVDEHGDAPGGAHGHLPVDPRRVRGRHRRAVRARARRRRAGLRRRRQPQRPRRAWPSPGRFGADVSHLNLHKTFCIPHGGGGPGVGPGGGASPPGAVPAQPPAASPTPGRPPASGPVAAAPWGSAGILPIPWAYIRLMGADGLRGRTAGGHPQRQLRGPPPRRRTTRCSTPAQGGCVAHECILDLRPLTKATGVTVEDVAKRLIDYGFHAPTMSFPVAGTLMVEPTESRGPAPSSTASARR